MVDTSIEESNATLVYEYTLRYVEMMRTSYDRLNTRLSALVGFSGLLLKFAADLPSDAQTCPVCLLSKIGACLLLGVAVGLGVWGLYAKAIGTIVAPRFLLQDEEYVKPNELCKLTIAKNLSQAADDLSAARRVKARRLNWQIAAVVGAISMFLVNIIVDAVFL